MFWLGHFAALNSHALSFYSKTGGSNIGKPQVRKQPERYTPLPKNNL
jgi:hypothetical protein